MRCLKNKKALVTGGAAGIGRAIALRLAREGASVVILDINEGELAKTITLVQQHGVEAVGRHCDVSVSSEIRDAVQGLIQDWGELDILVNNAGVCYYGPSQSMSEEQWQRLLSINFLAPIEFSRQLLPVLLSRPEAHILNVASMYGIIATNRCTAYHASKFGLIGFSEALRAEYGRHGLGVTALCPGYVDTDIFTSMIGKHQRRPPKWLCCSPDYVASKAVKAIYRDKRLVTVSASAHAASAIRRWAPGLLDRLYRIGRTRKVRAKQLRLAAQENTQVARLPSQAA